jgi:hypothetical protein
MSSGSDDGGLVMAALLLVVLLFISAFGLTCVQDTVRSLETRVLCLEKGGRMISEEVCKAV